MVYRITVRSNPRIFGIFFIIIALPVAGIVSFAFAPPFLSIILIGSGLFFAYSFWKLVRSTLGSQIRTHDDGIVFDFGKGHVNKFSWDEITHCGVYAEPRGKRSLFIYDEDEDRLITVPNEYEAFDDLVNEVHERTADLFETVDLATKSTINDYLRSIVSKSEDDSAKDSEDDSGDEASEIEASTEEASAESETDLDGTESDEEDQVEQDDDDLEEWDGSIDDDEPVDVDTDLDDEDDEDSSDDEDQKA